MSYKCTIHRKLNFALIQHIILNQGVTLSEAAVKNGMPEDAFIDEVKRCIGEKKFKKLEIASKHNEDAKQNAIDDGHKDVTTTAPVENTEVNGMTGGKKTDGHVAANNGKAAKEMMSVQENLEKLEAELAKARTHADSMRGLAESAEVLMGVAESEVNEAKGNVEAAEKMLAEAKTALKTAEEKLATQKKQYDSHEAAKVAAEKVVGEKEAEIDKIKNTVYLVASSYAGPFPEGVRLVSTYNSSRFKSEIQQGTELYKEPPYDYVYTHNFKSIDHFRWTVEYAKLCVRYHKEGKPMVMLVNDQKTIEFLRFQGLEVNGK